MDVPFATIQQLHREGKVRLIKPTEPEMHWKNFPQRVLVGTTDGKFLETTAVWDKRTQTISMPPATTWPIDWSTVNQVFSFHTSFAPAIPRLYYGSDEVLNRDDDRDFGLLIYTAMAQLGNDTAKTTTTFVDMVGFPDGEIAPALVREWNLYSGARVQLWLVEDKEGRFAPIDSWAFVYASRDTFLIGGLRHYHPFVITPQFAWDSPDELRSPEFQAETLPLDAGTVNLRGITDHVQLAQAALVAIHKMPPRAPRK